MEYVRSLKTIHPMDEHLCGERALDLATLSEKGYAVPPSFVVTNDAFEAFVLNNRLQQKIGAALQESDAKVAHERVRDLILKAQMPQEIVEAITEAYEGVSVDPDASAQQLIRGVDKPLVNVFLSTNYTLPEITSGTVLDVRGVEQVLVAVREAWASLFSPAMRTHRANAGVGERNLNAGIIIQRSPSAAVSVEAHSGEEILVWAYFGGPDLTRRLGKDEWRLSKEYLKPLFQRVGVQKEMVGRDEDEHAVTVPIGARGVQQKLPDRDAMEIGRQAKKAAMLLERPVRLLFDVKGEKMQLLLCTRQGATQQYSEDEAIEESPSFFSEKTPEAQQAATQTSEEEDSIFASVDDNVQEPVRGREESPTDEKAIPEETETTKEELTEEKEYSEENILVHTRESVATQDTITTEADEEGSLLDALASEEQDVAAPAIARTWTITEARDAVTAGLRTAYEARFRHVPPEEIVALYAELQAEVHLPHEELVERVISTAPGETLNTDDAASLLTHIESILKQL